MIKGKRNRGRPHKRWVHDIHEETDMGVGVLNSASKDQDQWKHITHVHAQSGLAGDSKT